MSNKCLKILHKNFYKSFNIHEATPQCLYNLLDEEFHFNFDPCPLSKEIKVDGLEIDWKENCFINPPYGKEIRKWLEKGLNEIEKGNSVTEVFLLPSYTDVKWFHEVVLPNASEIRFVKGRLKFGTHSENAPFASMLVVFRNEKVFYND